MSLYQFFAIYLLLTSLVSCGKKTEKKDVSGVSEQKLYIKGELSAMYGGATLNRDTFFKSSEVEDFNGFLRIGLRYFSNHGKKQEKKLKDLNETETVEELEKGQEAEIKNIADNSQVQYSFKKSGKDWVYTAGEGQFKMYFKTDGVQLIPYKFMDEVEREANIEILHYSLALDRNSFSILAKFEAEGIEYLMSSTFSKKSDQKLIKLSEADESFSYLLGPTKRAILVRGSEINLCGNKINWMVKEFKTAFDSWNKDLPKNYITFKTLENYPPFSDVNTKCIYITEDFAFSDPDGDIVKAGFVLPLMNIGKREIVDIDMFIGLSEWERVFEGRNYGSLYNILEDKEVEARGHFRQTVVHELGHMLGLDHVFDGKKSVMSYDDSFITDYDIRAIRNLYSPFYSTDEEK